MINEGGSYTRQMTNDAISGTMGIEEAIRYLKQDAHIRTVRETLAQYSGVSLSDEKALKKKIVDLLAESNPSEKRDSVDRKVRGWMREDTREISKAGAIQLAYALRLPLEQAEKMMARLCGDAFHWRDPEDIVWVFGLNNGLDYAAATGLMRRLEERGLLTLPGQESLSDMTAVVRQEVEQLGEAEDLAEFLKNARPRLGRMHNTAYTVFDGMMTLLQEPGQFDTLPQERDMPVREIVSTYMYNDYIPRARRVGKSRKEVDALVLSAIQRNIRQNWPDETTLSRMTHREIDVTRKVMILLFLATDGGESAYGDLSDVTPESVFQDMYARLSLMLAECGFAPLDSRVPFDWMVLYCMCADESLFVDDNVRGFLEGIFPATPEPSDE